MGTVFTVLQRAILLAAFASPLAAAPALEAFSESRTDVAEWTIAVYLDADNDLEKFALIDLNEMEAGLSGDVNVIVLVDRAAGYDESDGNWTDARVYRVVPDRDKSAVRSRVIARPGELNMGDPAALERFLAATLESFPAKRHALVLWNHGGGWASHAVDHGVPGKADAADDLRLPELSGAIKGALAKRGLQKLDLIGFDMCLMAQYEVALELGPLGKVLVASQATEPGDGWPYERVLPAFATASRSTPALARHVVEVFDAYYREREEPIATLSAYDLERLPDFSQQLDRVLAKLEASLPSIWPDVSRSIFFAEGYASRTELQRGSQALASIDLLDVLRRMEHNTRAFPASAELRGFEKAFGAFVLSSKASPLRRRSTGVAIYAPVARAVMNEGYGTIAASSVSRWRRFLDRLHEVQSASGKPPVIRDLQLVDWKSEKPITEARPFNTHGIAYVVEGTNLLWMYGLSGQWDTERKGVLVVRRGMIRDANWSVRERETATDRLDLMTPQFRDGRNVQVTVVPGYRYMVSNGAGKAFYATVDESGEDSITVPIVFHHPQAGDFRGRVHFHDKWWFAAAVELDMPQKNGSVVYRQIKPEASDEVTLLFEYLEKDGRLSYTEGKRIPWNGGLELLMALEPAGEYVVGLTAQTIGGQSGHALFEYRMAEDPDLKSFLEMGSKFEKDDLIGRWEMIEPETFTKSGQIVPNGVLVEYRQHPEKQNLLVSELTAPQRNRQLAIRNLVYLDTRLLPHARSFRIASEGLPDDPLAVDYSVDLVLMLSHKQSNRPVLVLRNTVSESNYIFAKVSGGAPAGAASMPGPGGDFEPPPGGGTSQPQPPAPQAPASLDGVWQREDGVILIIQGQQFQVNQYGMAIDAGMFQVQGNVLVSQSAYTGALEQYQFAYQADVLQLRDAWGGVYVYRRIQ